MPLHLTKVAYGCRTIEAVERKVERWSSGGEMRVATRMRPKRAAECVGGYLHYIVKHRIVARIQILGFEDRKDGRIDIVSSNQVEMVTRSRAGRTRAGAISRTRTRRGPAATRPASARFRRGCTASFPASGSSDSRIACEAGARTLFPASTTSRQGGSP